MIDTYRLVVILLSGYLIRYSASDGNVYCRRRKTDIVDVESSLLILECDTTFTTTSTLIIVDSFYGYRNVLIRCHFPASNVRLKWKLSSISVSNKVETLKTENCDSAEYFLTNLKNLKSAEFIFDDNDNDNKRFISLEYPSIPRQLTELTAVNIGIESIISNYDNYERLCSLSRLNLRRNRIRRIRDSISSCTKLSELADLNLSENRIEYIDKSDFDIIIIPYLKRLNLSRNRIETIRNESFESLTNLLELDLSFNRLETISDTIFISCGKLERLDLSSNYISSFYTSSSLSTSSSSTSSTSSTSSSSTTSSFSLRILNLSRNKLRSDSLNLNRFENLAELDLSRNEIRDLHPSLFRRSVSRLEILNLSYNLMVRISLRDLTSLRIVTLSGNRIERIDVEMFTSFNGSGRRRDSNVSVADFSNNEIESIHPNAFDSLSTSLTDLSLERNKLTYFPSEVISKLRELRTLNMGQNRLIKLDNDTFYGYDMKITDLNLYGNALDEIGSDVFSKLFRLRILNLSENRISKMDRNWFVRNTNLETIRIDSNRIEDIVGIFKGLSKLISVNASHNRIEKFDWFLVPSNSLRHLDLSFNSIDEIGNYFRLERQFTELRTLNVSANKLTFIKSDIFPPNLRILNLHDNNISRIEPFTFAGMKSLRRVDLFANKIRHLTNRSLRLFIERTNSTMNSTSKPEFYLGGNPFVCDCELEWLITVNGDEIDSSSSSSSSLSDSFEIGRHFYPTVMDLESIYCLSERPSSNRIVPLVESSDFLCSYETHCFALCHCCDFDACDCEMTCPDTCKCYHDRSWTVNIVDCRSSRFKQPPTAIPMDATEVYLQGNEFNVLSSHSFIGRKNLEILFLNDSNVETILNNTFSGLFRLRILRLDRNNIQVLSGIEFTNLFKLEFLSLARNRISVIYPDTFRHLTNLRTLELHENRLRTLDFNSVFSPILPFNSSSSIIVYDITLSGNPWNCSAVISCLEYSRWKRRIVDQFPCFDECDYISNTTITTTTKTTSLDNRQRLSEYVDNVETIFSEGNLPIIIIVASFVIVVVVFIGVLFYYRDEIRILAFDWSGVRSKPDLLLRDYDVYVGYSSSDNQWVRHVLAVHLEDEEHYRLLLHYRDFDNPIPNSIADTIFIGSEHSSSLLFVISKHFITFEWNRYEVRSAIHTVIGQRRSNFKGQKSRNIIFVLVGDITTRDLDPDLRLYLKQYPIIKWTDRLFWARLRYRLPEPSSIAKPNEDGFYTIPYPPDPSLSNNRTLLSSAAAATNSSRIPDQNHYFTLSSRSHQRVYDENNLQLAPKILERSFKLN